MAIVACHNEPEYGMKIPILSLPGVAAALAATVIACGSAEVTAAPAQDHAHDASSPARLGLDHGRKWATDDALRSGMARIRALVGAQAGATGAAGPTPAEYAALAGRIEVEVGGIVANCKLKPRADAMLHLVIGEIGAGTDAMAGKTAARSPRQGLVQVAAAVNDYARHFDHPGFVPIRNVH